MDKIYISQAGEEKLFQWRDAHKEIVRSYIPAIKKTKYILENGKLKVIITVIDNNSHLVDFTITQAGERLERFCWNRHTWKVERQKPSKIAAKAVSDEVKNSAISIHCSVQALLSNPEYEYIENQRKEVLNDDIGDMVDKLIRKKYPKINNHNRKISISDIITKYCSDSDEPKRKRIIQNKCSHEFNVRGHYRHYKTGKVIWINEYKKNVGNKKRSKSYCLEL